VDGVVTTGRAVVLTAGALRTTVAVPAEHAAATTSAPATTTPTRPDRSATIGLPLVPFSAPRSRGGWYWCLEPNWPPEPELFPVSAGHPGWTGACRCLTPAGAAS
jgi:hypothetical protein